MTSAVRQIGFTIIGLITVILITGILFAASIALIPDSNRVKASAFIETFIGDLRLTKILAMSENENYNIIINSTGYSIQDASGNTYSYPDGETTTTFPQGFSLSPASITLTFNSLGQPMDGGNIKSSDTTLTASSGSYSRTITIYGQTGFINEES